MSSKCNRFFVVVVVDSSKNRWDDGYQFDAIKVSHTNNGNVQSYPGWYWKRWNQCWFEWEHFGT